MSASEPATFDFMSPQLQSDPYEFYEELHKTQPVYRVPETGVYLVSKYEDVRFVLLHHELFSNRFGDSFLALQSDEGRALYEKILEERGWPHFLSLQSADPPLHTKQRRLVDKGFNPKMLREMKPFMDTTCHLLIDAFIDRSECEFIAEFATPFPGTMIANMIGLDPSELKTFKRWADAVVAPISEILTPDEIVRTAETEIEFQHFLAGEYEKRRKEPRDDIISLLANEPADNGQRISMSEFQFIMRQLVAAGFTTTVQALAHSLWLLFRYPEQMERVKSDPSVRQAFIEESLRFESPVQGLYRRAVQDITLGGVDIPADSIVMVRYGAANRDEAQFACPHMFDPDRKNVMSHVGFGYGVHFCVGRNLARLELARAFDALFERLDNIALARPLPDPPHVFSMFERELKELPITFDKKR